MSSLDFRDCEETLAIATPAAGAVLGQNYRQTPIRQWRAGSQMTALWKARSGRAGQHDKASRPRAKLPALCIPGKPARGRGVKLASSPRSLSALAPRWPGMSPWVRRCSKRMTPHCTGDSRAALRGTAIGDTMNPRACAAPLP